jgi:response regulator of citrate/malate metabolism
MVRSFIVCIYRLCGKKEKQVDNKSPGISRLDVLRERGIASHVVIAETMDKALKLGAMGYIIKPFSVE